MKRVLVDVNVLLDVVLRREPWVHDAVKLCTDKATLLAAGESALTDFEDAVSAEAALATECDWIVTRDAAGFAGSPMPTVAPGTALALLNES